MVWSESQLRVTRKAGCMHNGSPVSPDDLPSTVRETLIRVVKGESNGEIADSRHYARSSVTRHITALFVVYGARNRAHLAALAVERGDVHP